jgi:hypothetical protein
VRADRVGGGARQKTSSSLGSAGLPAAAARRDGGGVDGPRARAVEDLAVQGSPSASGAPADRVGGGDRQTTSSSSSSGGASMPPRGEGQPAATTAPMRAGESAPGRPGGVDAPETDFAARATGRAAAETGRNSRRSPRPSFGDGMTARAPGPNDGQNRKPENPGCLITVSARVPRRRQKVNATNSSTNSQKVNKQPAAQPQ